LSWFAVAGYSWNWELHILEEALKAAHKRPTLHYGDKLLTALLQGFDSSALLLALFMFSPLRLPAFALCFGLLTGLLA